MVCYCKGLYVCWYNISCFDGGHSVHSDITYHVLQIIHSKSLSQVVEDSWTILLELEVTGKVLSGGGTAKTALQNVSMGFFHSIEYIVTYHNTLGLSASYIIGV